MGKTQKTPPTQTRYRVYPEEFAELLGRNPDASTLARIGITARQFRLWLSTSAGVWISPAQYHLMQFQRQLHLSELMGRDWDGFVISGNALTVPGLKRPLTPGELSGLWLYVQQPAALSAQVAQLKRDNERLSEQIDDMESELHFYRRQCRLESTMGMMLARVAL